MGDCDVFAGPKLIESLMHNCRGRIDALMPELVGMIHVRLHLDDSDGQPGLGLTTLLYTALGSAIHYNPLLTLQILEHRQCQAALLTSWVKHLGTICERPCVRAHDLKIALLAVSSMLAMPTATAPYVIASNRLMLPLIASDCLPHCMQVRDRVQSADARAPGLDAAGPSGQSICGPGAAGR